MASAMGVAATPARGADVRLEGLVKSYGRVRAVDGVSLAVPRGQFVTLLGPSGSGKTTTLMMLAGFVEPDEGDVFIAGSRVTETPPHRRALGMVFQHYALFPHLTVFDNIAYPLRMRRVARPVIRQRVQAALSLVRLPDVGARYPRQLSGGQQQRIALARALVYEPQLLLMDEPLGALDKKLREEMQIELRTLQQRFGITTLYVTHDQEEAMALSDRIVVMRDGHVEQDGTPAELYEQPRTRFVADFIGVSNCLDGKLERTGAGWEFVTSEGLRLPVEAPPGEPADSRHLVIRPERIRWADAEPTEVAAAGVLTAVMYLGERVRYRVHLDGGPMLTVTHPNLPGRRPLVPGTPVRLGWHRADASVV
jgi:putative spermidine/putrescine transport system ATP-binding protein